MPPGPDIAALAARFLDLWERQAAAAAADPALAERMLHWTAREFAVPAVPVPPGTADGNDDA